MVNRKKPLVVVTRKLPDIIETRMCELFDTRLNESDMPLTADQLIEALKVADVLVPTVTDRLDAAVLSHAGPNLRLIANFGNGVDNIDVPTAVQRGINVTNTPGVLTEDTADMTMALIIAVPRRLAEGFEVLEHGEWGGWSPTWMMGRRIHGKRLGIIGMGRIGTALWPIVPRPLACRSTITTAAACTRASRPDWRPPIGESLDQMLARMDFVSVNCPHTPGTYHLLSARRLKLMRKDAYIINTARGEIIDENALVRMIEAGDLAGCRP